MGISGCLQVCVGVHGCAGGCVGVHGCGREWVEGGCVGVDGCMNVCGMNFQNIFWRIESLHQRTLIRILYEFFSL